MSGLPRFYELLFFKRTIKKKTKLVFPSAGVSNEVTCLRQEDILRM